MSKVQTIVDQLKDLTLIEASELVTAIEDTFNVTAAAPAAAVMAMPMGAGDGGAAAADEQTEFTVKVTEVPADKKIAVIKVVKTILNIGLGEAKTMVESAPFAVAEKVDKAKAEDYKKQLGEAGAAVVLE